MNDTTKITAVPATPASPKMPIFSSASAMAMMWEVAYKQMSAQEMKWFADGAAEQVNTDVKALSAVLEETACLVAADETGSFQSAKSTSTLLFHLHNQLSAIAGMAEISEQANWYARRAVKGGAA